MPQEVHSVFIGRVARSHGGTSGTRVGLHSAFSVRQADGAYFLSQCEGTDKAPVILCSYQCQDLLKEMLFFYHVCKRCIYVFVLEQPSGYVQQRSSRVRLGLSSGFWVGSCAVTSGLRSACLKLDGHCTSLVIVYVVLTHAALLNRLFCVSKAYNVCTIRSTGQDACAHPEGLRSTSE